MHLKLSKSDLILNWKICVISGVSFMLTTIFMHWLIHLSYPDSYEFFELYMSSIYFLSSAIVGGYCAPIIFRVASKEKYLVDLLKNVFFILICETILISFLSALLFLYFRGDIGFSLLSFVAFMPLFLILYGKWKIVQITIAVGILFLGFRYIRDREPRK